jgi:hypothetical protein
MRNFFLALAVLAILSFPAYAQHKGGGSGGSKGGTHSAGSHNGGQRGGDHRGDRGGYRGGYHGGWHGGYRIDGYRWGHGFGYAHPFGWGGVRWFGPRFVVGSRFWFGGFWFTLYDPIPVYWYDGSCYVDEIDGAYYVVNPAYPGVHIGVGVVF